MSAVNLLSSLREKPCDDSLQDGSREDGKHPLCPQSHDDTLSIPTAARILQTDSSLNKRFSTSLSSLTVLFTSISYGKSPTSPVITPAFLESSDECVVSQTKAKFEPLE